MKIQQRIDAFERFGETIAELLNPSVQLEEYRPEVKDVCYKLIDSIQDIEKLNPWFTSKNVRLSMHAISAKLSKSSIKTWIDPYMEELGDKNNSFLVAVVMAGNIPLVGFFDFFYILMSGNKFLGKLSSQDNKLLPLLSELLIIVEPGFYDMIEFTEDRLSGFDAVIATGSDNTSRYFDFYFKKYPNIIRNSRSSVAVLTGHESNDDLSLLGSDIFSYFGRGCRNVSKIFIPRSFSLDVLFKAIQDFKYVAENYKYMNNYDYYKSIYLLNKEKFFDNGFLMMKENPGISSAVATIFYEYYDDLNTVQDHLIENKDRVQCIVCDSTIIPEGIPFGTSQYPQLWDYADNIDTMKFLLGLQ